MLDINYNKVFPLLILKLMVYKPTLGGWNIFHQEVTYFIFHIVMYYWMSIFQ